MFRNILLFAVMALLIGLSEAQGGVIDSNWVGNNPQTWGGAKRWDDADNWNPAVVPDNDSDTFNVTIDSNSVGEKEVQVGVHQNRTVNRIDCYGEVGLVCWDWVKLTIEQPGYLTNHGELDIKGGFPSAIYGSLINACDARLWLHNIYINENLYNQTGATIVIDGGSVTVDQGEVQNAGVIMIPPTTNFLVHKQLYNYGEIRVYGGECSGDSLLSNESNGIIRGFGTIFTGAPLINKGGIHASDGSLVVAIEGPFCNKGTMSSAPSASLNVERVFGLARDANNSGIIEVNPSSSVIFDCNVVNEPSGVIRVLGGTLAAKQITQSVDANFVGFGTIAGEVQIEPNGLISITGPTNVIGNVNILTGATLEISDGQTLITGHTVNNGTIRCVGGTVIFQGGYNGSGQTFTVAGTDRNHFDVNNDGIQDFKDFASFAENWLWQASWY